MSRLFALLAGLYCTAGLILWLQIPVWHGRQKAILLALHAVLFLPACAYAARRLSQPDAPLETKSPDREPFQLPGLPFLLFVSLGLLLGFSALCNRGLELPDESVYTFQARAITTGHLSAPGPPLEIAQDPALRRTFSFVHHLVLDGRWFGKYPPGFPTLLSIAQRLQAQVFLNALLTWGVLCLTALIARQAMDSGAAKWAVLGLVFSPFFFLNSTGYYSHNLAAFLVAAATAAAVRSRHSAPLFWMGVSVLSLGACLLVRPFTTVLTGTVLAAYLGTVHWNQKRLVAASLTMWTVVGGCAVVAYLYLQKQLTNSWRVSPYSLYYGAGVVPKELNAHPTAILANLTAITAPSIADTLLTTLPLTLPLALWSLWCGFTRKRPDSWMFAALFWCLVLGYTLQTETSTSSVGERYYYEGYFGAVLAAVAMGRQWVSRASRLAGTALLPLLLAGCLLPWAVYTGILINGRRPYHEMELAARATGPPTQLVFLGNASPDFFGTWFNLNGVDWQTAPVLYLIDPGPEHRDRAAKALGRNNWSVLEWDPVRRTPVTVPGPIGGAAGGH